MQKIFPVDDLQQKVKIALIDHVYANAHLTIVSSLLCAILAFIGLYPSLKNDPALWGWAGIFIFITCVRFGLLYQFRTTSPNIRAQAIDQWEYWYVVGAVFGGISWGLASVMLFPSAAIIGKIFLILMISGVTAGAVPLTAAIPAAAIGFLIFSLVPFIVVIGFFSERTYILLGTALLFAAACTIYLLYSIFVTIKSYRLIKDAISLRFENDALVKGLIETKQQLEVTNKKLKHSATHDSLTQAANRSLFQTNLENVIKRAKQRQRMIALLYLDLDHFKVVNDTYGHDVGDRLLIHVIEKLNGFFDKDSFVARLGGDEITIILSNIASREEVGNLAQALCQLIAEPMSIDDIPLEISASVGISIFPEDGSDIPTLLWQADKAMYHAKENGGNRSAFYTDVNHVVS